MSFQPSYQPRAVPPYQPCDSYFVESHEDAYHTTRVDTRERARRAARDRQLLIAEELSRKTCEEYQSDAETLPDVASIDIQTEIKWFMRPYLLDFLVEAHAAFQLLPETLFLAVNLLDRYCSKRVVYKRHYQLVGCASLLIAAKYGDRKDRVPTIRELKSMCCSLYDEDMFTQMEWHVLQTLNWAIGHPTVDNFLQIALSEVPYDPEVEYMSWYICEIAMFHKEFVSVRPSVMARSALALARCILGRGQPEFSDWSAEYDSYTMVSLSQQLHRPSQVLSKKYGSSHFASVAVSMEVFLARQASIARSYAPPTPPCEMASYSTERKSMASPNEEVPQTPQKGQYPMNMPNGVLTPPITPDGDSFSTGAYVARGLGIAPPRLPATPSFTSDSSMVSF